MHNQRRHDHAGYSGGGAVMVPGLTMNLMIRVTSEQCAALLEREIEHFPETEKDRIRANGSKTREHIRRAVERLISDGVK